jgi:hypothetical protein
LLLTDPSGEGPYGELGSKGAYSFDSSVHPINDEGGFCPHPINNKKDLWTTREDIQHSLIKSRYQAYKQTFLFRNH